MKKFDSLKDAIAARVATLRKVSEDRRARVLEASTCNGTQEAANYSRAGWHAPHDGWFSMENEEVYAKGQLLPWPRDDWSHSDPGVPFHKQKFRIMIDADQQQELRDAVGDYAEIGFGNTWNVEARRENGHITAPARSCCYAYLEGYDPVIKVVEKYFEEQKQARFDQIRASKGEAPEGVLEVMGVIKKIKNQPGYDNGDYSLKILVQLENKATAWGTLPRALSDEAEVGDVIEFKANFTRAQNDSTHSFFSRPRGAVLTKTEKPAETPAATVPASGDEPPPADYSDYYPGADFDADEDNAPF